MTVQCNYIVTGKSDARGHEFLCEGCGTRLWLPTLRVVPRGNCNPALAARHRAEASGPGTELHKIFDSLGIVPRKSCDCAAMTARMNGWGPDGCEANMAEIKLHLSKAYAGQPLVERLRVKTAAVTSGLAFEINWLDPIPSLVRLAIERAREKQLPIGEPRYTV
jgi:hypothetical protein